MWPAVALWLTWALAINEAVFMIEKISESDWKKFCKIKEITEERFCEQSVQEYKESIEDGSRSYVERDIYSTIK